MALAAATGVPGTTAAPRARHTTQMGTSRPTTLPAAGRRRTTRAATRRVASVTATSRARTRTRKPTSAAMAPGRPSDPVSNSTTDPARCQSAVGSNGRDSTFTKPKSSTVSMVSRPSTAPAAVARTIPTRAGSTTSSAAPSTASSGRCSAAGPTAPGWPGRTRAARTRAPANPVSTREPGPTRSWPDAGRGTADPAPRRSFAARCGDPTVVSRARRCHSQTTSRPKDQTSRPRETATSPDAVAVGTRPDAVSSRTMPCVAATTLAG